MPRDESPPSKSAPSVGEPNAAFPEHSPSAATSLEPPGAAAAVRAAARGARRAIPVRDGVECPECVATLGDLLCIVEELRRRPLRLAHCSASKEDFVHELFISLVRTYWGWESLAGKDVRSLAALPAMRMCALPLGALRAIVYVAVVKARGKLLAKDLRWQRRYDMFGADPTMAAASASPEDEVALRELEAFLHTPPIPEQEAVQIWLAIQDGELTQKEVGELFGLSQATVSRRIDKMNELLAGRYGR